MLLPPVTLIFVALAMWYVLEWIAWVVLSLHCQVQTRDGGPSKRVNQPRFSMKL